MTELTFTETTCVIAHDGNSLVHYIECEPGTSFGTGQPYVEQFTDEAAARARAIELGYVFTEEIDHAPF